jgi:hypothetical protein
MIVYVIKKYLACSLIITILVAILLWAFGAPHIVFKSLCWAGGIAVYVTYWRFKRQNLWVLYDNLCLSRWWLLGLCCVGFEGIVIGIHIVWAG